MLDIMRKYAGSWFIKVILVGVALSFVGGFLLLPSVKKRQGMENTAAEVNGHPIYRQEWEEAYHRTLQAYREMFKDQMDENMLAQFNLKDRALQGLIEKRLQMEAADRLDVQVSDHEVQQSILTYDAFQRDGRFDIDLYRRLLRANRISEDEFIARQREAILLQKLDSLISDSCKVSDKEVRDEFMIKNEKVNLSYVEIRSTSFLDDVEIEEGQAADYHESNKNDFLTDPKVKVEYLKFSPAGFEADIRLDDDEVFDYYDVNLETYSDPEKIKASHILIKANRQDPQETRDEARKRIDDLMVRVNAGEDFAMLARQYSEDQKTAVMGGDLGFFERGKMVKAFEDAAFSLKPGEISEVVESPFGFHVIRVDGYLEAKTKPFDAVKGEIRAKLVSERATRRASRKADALQVRAAETRDLASLAEGEMVVFDTTDFFAADETVPGIGRKPSFFMTADSMIVGDVSDVIEVDKDFVIVKLLEREEPRVPALEEIRDDVEAALKASRSRELARARAGEIQEKLAGGASLQALSDEYDLNVRETGAFTRERDLIPRIGPSAELKRAAFGLTPEAPVPTEFFEVREKLVLVELKEHMGGDDAAFASESANLKEKLLGSKRMEMVQRWMDSLKVEAEISVNPNMEIQ